MKRITSLSKFLQNKAASSRSLAAELELLKSREAAFVLNKTRQETEGREVIGHSLSDSPSGNDNDYGDVLKLDPREEFGIHVPT